MERQAPVQLARRAGRRNNDPLTGMLAWAVPKTRTGSLINFAVVVEAPEHRRPLPAFGSRCGHGCCVCGRCRV